MSKLIDIAVRGGTFTDSALALGENGHPALAIVPRIIAQAVQDRQHRGRPIFHFWGNWTDKSPLSFFSGSTCTFTIARFNMLDGGCKSERGLVHGIPTGGDLSTTAGLYMDGYYTAHAEGSHGTNYPDPVIMMDMRPSVSDTDPAIAPGYPSQQTIVADTVLPMAGCVYEDSIEAINDISTSVSTLGFGASRDILAAQTGNYGTTERLRERLMHVWMNRRPILQWCGFADNLNTDGAVTFDASTQSYRYLFDQTVGTGGTAPSATGPAMTLPLRYSAAGISTMVRVYIWVRAAMSGATDGGSIGVANKDASGTMTAFRALTNPPTIGGTGFAWYPSLGAFTASTNPYFMAYANGPFDRVLLGAKSNGTTDAARIAGFMLAVYPSEA